MDTRAPASLILALACGIACTAPAPTPSPASGSPVAVAKHSLPSAAAARPEGWDDYWYSGLAELNTYTLTQRRYGEERAGTEVLIFVTEPFLPEAQVKDDGAGGAEESVSVLKLNRVRRFTTGIYDYSLMLSAFTPVSRDRHPHTLKTTLSAQDWCGHSWFQLNRRGAAYAAERRSYFQAEGDTRSTIAAPLLEDELPALVRLDPLALPRGEVSIVPGAMFSALRHVMPEAQSATLAHRTEGEQFVVTLTYPTLERILETRYDAAFPNVLQSWTETIAGVVESTGRLRRTAQQPYWQLNAAKDSTLRAELSVE